MRITLFIVFVSLALCPVSQAAQTNGARAGEGGDVRQINSLDAIRFKHGSQELSFDEVQEKWEDLSREYILRQMGTVRHPTIVDFLSRVASADPKLYRTRRPKLHADGEMAIWSLTRTNHPLVAAKLEAILKAPMGGVEPEAARKVKGKAAQELLRIKGSNRGLAYKHLNEIALEGHVLCPYPPPGSFYRDDGAWLDPPVDAAGRELVRKWLSHENGIVRLEAARCMSEAGIQDRRVRGFAEAELSKEPEDKSSRERFLAEQIIKALAAHGDKQSAKASDRLEIEKEIKRLSTGHPEGDRNLREHFEKEFRKKWPK